MSPIRQPYSVAGAVVVVLVRRVYSKLGIEEESGKGKGDGEREGRAGGGCGGGILRPRPPDGGLLGARPIARCSSLLSRPSFLVARCSYLVTHAV